MSNETYQDLMLRFAKELHEVGVSENLKKVVEERYTRVPNLASVEHNEITRKFTYRHNGYEIEASQSVKLKMRKCT